MYKSGVKRGLDIVISVLLILVLSPVLLFLILSLAIVNRGNPFFLQTRPGKNDIPFTFIKFKTMNDARDEEGNLLPDNARLTGWGAGIRKLSLDELPQLFNVLIGDMSLVGPRPLLMKYLPLYSTEQRRRHSVRPGITGWAQVNGRNSITWTQKFELDVYYVEHLSFSLDFRILWITLMKVVKREGINQSNDRPMQPFTGNS